MSRKNLNENAIMPPSSIQNKRIVKAKAFDCSSDEIFLNLLNGKHCFLLMELQSGEKVRIQRTKNHFFIKQFIQFDSSQKNIFEIGLANISSNHLVLDIFNFCNQQYTGTNYHVIGNNCYDFLITLCQKLEVKSLQQKVIKRKKFIVNLALDTFNANTNGKLLKPLTYIDQAAMIMKNSDQLIALARAGKTAGQITGKAAGSIKALQFASITPLGIGVTIAAQTFSQVMDMKHNNFQTKAVVKGVANIAVGTGGTIGGSVLGATIGTAVCPIIGTAIGGMVGSIGGGIIAKKIMPWNWFS